MLKKINRLPVLRTGAIKQIFDTPLFKIKIFKIEGDAVRFGFVVSKKVDRRAVFRNKTKRILAEAARIILPEFKTGTGIILVAKKKLSGDNFEEVIGEQRKIFKKANLLK